MPKHLQKRYDKLLKMANRTVEEQLEFDKLDALKDNLTMKREALKHTTQSRGITVAVNRVEDNSNTLSFVFISDDNAGKRFDWGSGEYYDELLDVNGASVEHLNTFFKDHERSVDSAVGKISNVRVENGMLVGEVTFGSDEQSQRIYSKYAEGILTDVSVGYEIRDYKVEQGAENERDRVTVTDFEIFEVSAVGIGFDSGAKKRSDDENGSSEMNEEMKQRLLALEAMAKRTAEESAEMSKLQASRQAEVDAERERSKKLEAELEDMKRDKECYTIVAKHGEVAEKLYRDNNTISPDKLRALILDASVENTPPMSQGNSDTNTRSAMINAMIDGLALRVGAKIETPHVNAENYRHAKLIDIAGDLTAANGERGVGYLSPTVLAERALVSGDFPLLLQSVGSRVLTSEFEAQTATFKAWIKEVDVPDFRVMTDVTSTVGGGRLDKTLENGDLKELSATEKAETWKIESFGNKFVLTREMIINDDLGAFTNLLATFGRMALATANGIAYDILQGKNDYSSYKMADGSGVFIAARNNSSTAALSPEAISAGRLAMAKHKSNDGETPLNIRPKYLIVPPALEETAREILGATNKISPDANTGEINVHQNSLELIVDAELTSDTTWFLMADTRTVKMGYLAGTGRSPVVKMNDSTLSRTTFEGVFDIGVMVEDYKGLYRGNV